MGSAWAGSAPTPSSRSPDLLRTARRSLKMSVAFLSRLDRTTQHLEVMESPLPLVFRDGMAQPQDAAKLRLLHGGRTARHLHPAELPGEHRRDVDPFAMHTDSPARGDEHIPIVERIFDRR